MKKTKNWKPLITPGFKRHHKGNSLAVQWLGLCASTAGGMGSIPGQGTKIPQAEQGSQKKRHCNGNEASFIWLYDYLKLEITKYK